MQTYKPIRALKLENFMSVACAEIPIGQIVSLCGYNDQGKSAVRTALEVLLYDAYATEQARFIKDGTDYFSVSLTFEDNVVISKEKRVDGTSIWTMLQGAKTLYTNARTDGTVVAVEDVPECIATYLGVYYDDNTKQELNIRKDRDPYFLVDSTGGDNYKLLNPLLHSEALSKASELLLKDSNACKSEYDTATVRLTVIQEQLEQKEIVPTDVLEKLDSSIVQVQQRSVQQEAAESVGRAYTCTQTCKVPPEVELADKHRIEILQQLVVQKQISEAPMPEEIHTCETARLDMLQQIEATKQQIQPVYDNITVVDANRLKMIEEINITATAYNDMVERAKGYAEQYNLTQEQLKEIAEELTANGYRVCPNCGNIVGENVEGHIH